MQKASWMAVLGVTSQSRSYTGSMRMKEYSAWVRIFSGALGTQVLLEAELADEIAAELESRSPGTSAGRLAELNLRLLLEAHETAHDLPGVTRVCDL